MPLLPVAKEAFYSSCQGGTSLSWSLVLTGSQAMAAWKGSAGPRDGDSVLRVPGWLLASALLVS